MKDARELADTLLAARTQGRDVGAFAVLRRYERARRGDNALTRKSMEAFNALFSNRIPPLRLLRNLGLRAADRSAVAKRFFMQQALGSGSDLPPLCRERLAG